MSIGGDLKGFEEFCRKALRLSDEDNAVSTARDCFEAITDIVRARIVCRTLADVMAVRTLLDEATAKPGDNSILWGGQTVFDEKNRTKTGYRAIHVDATVPVNESGKTWPIRCEIQLHTPLQYAWHMYTHGEFYKGEHATPLVRELMMQLSDLLHVADNVADELLREVEAARQTALTAPN